MGRRQARTARRLLVVTLMLALVGLVASAAEAPLRARAFLTGDQQIPPVETMALGYTVFAPDADMTKVHFRLLVANLEDVTAAHIHVGRANEDGPPVVNLFSGPAREGSCAGALAEGDFTAADLLGSMQGKTLKDLWNMAKDGRLYVNVHSDAHPDGEMRGQITLIPRTEPIRPTPA